MDPAFKAEVSDEHYEHSLAYQQGPNHHCELVIVSEGKPGTGM